MNHLYDWQANFQATPRTQIQPLSLLICSNVNTDYIEKIGRKSAMLIISYINKLVSLHVIKNIIDLICLLLHKCFSSKLNGLNRWDAYDQNHKQSLIQGKTLHHITKANNKHAQTSLTNNQERMISSNHAK